jgi:hypothetical protein
MSAFRNMRDLQYLPAAFDDGTFVMRAERAGNGDRQIATKAKMTALSQQVTNDYGVDLSALAQTVVLKRTYDAATANGGSDADLAGTYKSYRDSVKKNITEIYGSKTLPEARLDPTAKDFALSTNRPQLYDQEAIVYARVRTMLKDEKLRSRLADEISLVGAIKGVDAKLEKEALQDAPAAAPAGETTTASATPAQPKSGAGNDTKQDPSLGITGALKKNNIGD